MRRVPFLLTVAGCACLAGCTSGSGSFGSVTVDPPSKAVTTVSGDFALNDPTAHQRVEVAIRIDEAEKQARPMLDLSKGGDPSSVRQAECMQWLCMYFADLKADRFNGSENLRTIRNEIQAGLNRDVYSR
ncbi:MAG: hypothetical protein NT031_00505, partial [Planctomycetota bacterium]|nr:hypothetical protein [Planctomycetota bacterium]